MHGHRTGMPTQEHYSRMRDTHQIRHQCASISLTGCAWGWAWGWGWRWSGGLKQPHNIATKNTSLCFPPVSAVGGQRPDDDDDVVAPSACRWLSALLPTSVQTSRYDERRGSSSTSPPPLPAARWSRQHPCKTQCRHQPIEVSRAAKT